MTDPKKPNPDSPPYVTTVEYLPPETNPDSHTTEESGTTAGAGSGRPFGRPRTKDEIGTLGKYSILKEIGRGGMGSVYLAYDDKLKRKLAIKVMLPKYAGHGEARERFLREARMTAGIKHDHIVTVYEADEWHGTPFIAMEYLQGMHLFEYLRQKKPIGISQALRLAREVATGLSAAHKRGLIHRDIKPGNIWLEAPQGRVKILDFGLAKPANVPGEQELTEDGAVLGTPHYMAPEQAEGLPIDHRVDLFSLGVVLYRLLTGRLPFPGETTMTVLRALATTEPPAVQELNPNVPPKLAQLVTDLLQKSPAARPQSADEVLSRLRAVDRHGKPTAAAAKDSGTGTNAVFVPIPIAHREDSAFAHLDEEATVLAEPSDVVERRTRTRRRLRLVTAGLAVVALLTTALAVSPLLNLMTPKGTLAIESGEPVDVVIKKGGVLLHDRPKQREFALAVGDDYAIELAEPREGVKLTRDKFEITKNNRTTIKIQVDRPVVKLPPPVVVPDTSPPDRRAAKWALSVGGIVRVASLSFEIKEQRDLPGDEFQLTFVKLDNNSKVSDVGLAAFNGCTNLRELKLEGSPVTDAGLAPFAGCKNLLIFGVADTAVGDAGLAHLTGCKTFTVVNLANTRVTDRGLKLVEDCKNLKEVWLYRTKVGDEGMKAFKSCKSLARLDVADTLVGDAGLKELSELTSLRRIIVRQTRVTPAGIDALKAALPLCRVEWDGGTVEPKK